MVYPTTDSVRTQVVEAVRVALGDIEEGLVYRSTVRKALVGDLLPQSVEFPAVFIVPQAVTHLDTTNGMISEQMTLLVRCVTKAMGNGEMAHTGMSTISDLVEDCRIALLADHTLGGISKDLHVLSDVTYVENPMSPQYQADLQVSVDYRITRSLTGIDPGTAV